MKRARTPSGETSIAEAIMALAAAVETSIARPIMALAEAVEKLSSNNTDERVEAANERVEVEPEKRPAWGDTPALDAVAHERCTESIYLNMSAVRCNQMETGHARSNGRLLHRASYGGTRISWVG